jgi:hypothetical protein
MSGENPLWGAARIHGELLMLGFEVAQSTVSKYITRPSKPPSQSWKTFLQNHAEAIAAIDMCVVPTLTFDLLFAFLVLGHGAGKQRARFRFMMPFQTGLASKAPDRLRRSIRRWWIAAGVLSARIVNASALFVPRLQLPTSPHCARGRSIEFVQAKFFCTSERLALLLWA